MWSKILNMVRHAYVTLTNDDSTQFATAQINAMNKTMDMEAVYPYGLFAQAPLNSFVLVFTNQGNEESLSGICYDADRRFKNLKPGEAVLGNTLTGTYIKLDVDGNIEIFSKKDIKATVTGNVNLSAQQVNIDSPLTNLGSGGAAIARTGDAVKVTIGATDYFGTITGGGTNTSI